MAAIGIKVLITLLIYSLLCLKICGEVVESNDDAGNRLLACTILYFLKIQEQEKEFKSLIGEKGEQQKIRKSKLKVLIFNKCNNSLPVDLETQVFSSPLLGI